MDRVKRDFKKDIAGKVDLLPDGSDRFVITTPISYDDGDGLPIILKKERGDWWLSDEGGSLMHLSYDVDEDDLKTGVRREIIDRALEAFAMENHEGELRLKVNGQGVGAALYDFIHALLRIDDVKLLSRERVKSAFFSDFRHFVETRIPGERRQQDWHHPNDATRRYTVDYRINGRDEPLLLFALPSVDRVNVATISLLRLKLWGVHGEPVGIFQDQAKISPKAVARLSDVCPRLFPDLNSAAEQLPELYPDVLLPAHSG